MSDNSLADHGVPRAPGPAGALSTLRASLGGAALGRSMASTAVFNVAVSGAGALSGVVIARAARPAVSGEYSAVTSWLGITLMVAGLGQPVAVCFYVAQDRWRASAYVATSRNMMLATGATAAAIGMVVAPLLGGGHPGLATAYRMAFAGMLAYCVGNTYLFALMGAALGWWNRARLSQPLVALVGVVVLWRLRALTLDTTVEALLVSLLAQACWAYWGCRRVGLLPGRFRASLVRPLGGYGLAQIAAMAPASVNAYLDQLVLSVAVPPADLGRYSVAVSMTLLPGPLVSAIGYVLMPALAAGDVGDGASPRLPMRAVLVSAGLATAILVPLALIAPWLVPRVFGAYRGAVPLTWILTPGGIFLACVQVAANVLRGLRRQSVVARAEGVAIVFTLALLGSLVPVIGVTGAAIASTVSYGVSLALMLHSLRALHCPDETSKGSR